MVWLCTLVYLLVFLWGRILWGKWLNLLSIFGGFYFVVIFLANLRLNGIDAANDNACFVMICGGIFFAVGYTVIWSFSQNHLKNRRRVFAEYESSLFYYDTRSIRKKVFFVILIIVLLYAFYRLYILFTLLRMGYSYDRIRTIYFNSQYMFDEEQASVYGRNQLDIYLVQPLQLAAIIITSMNFFSNRILGLSKRWSAGCVALAFLSVLLTSIASGGRESIFYALLILFFSYAVMRRMRAVKEKKRLTNRQKRILRYFVIIVVLALVIITFDRSKTGENTMESLLSAIYSYFTGFFVHLGVRLNQLDGTSYTYGYAFILGLIKLPAAVLHRVFQFPVSDAYHIAEALTSSLQTRVSIGGGRTFNAYVGPFYYFFRDFGYFSLILESFIFGAVCAKSEMSFVAHKSVFHLFMYLFCFFLIISSMVRWEIVHPRTAMLLFYIPFIFKHHNKTESVLLKQ